MALLQATYPIAPKGLATNYEETSLPPDFALKFRNRFINAAGGAEKRRGIVQLGSAVAGGPTLNGLHEHINAITGVTTLFASGSGAIYRYNTTTSAWVTAYDSGYHGITYQSAQMVDRLIFVNGTSRNVYTKDGVTFLEPQAILTEGLATGDTSAGGLFDSTVTANG